jgi:hypothetical protein
MATELMVYSYKHGFSGFAAKLTESQAQKVSGSCSNKHYFLFHAFMFPHFILMQSRYVQVLASHKLSFVLLCLCFDTLNLLRIAWRYSSYTKQPSQATNN